MQRRIQWFVASIALCLGSLPVWAGTIIVTDGNVPAGSSTCTLAQAIYAANRANNPTDATPAGATTIGPLTHSATTSIGTGTCNGATSGSNTIYFGAAVAGTTLNFSTADNHWYGPNALPPIASTIMIDGGPAGIRLQNTHPTRLRFFFIGADPVAGGPTPGYNTPGPGNLNLRRATLSDGRQLGGAGHNAGGGGGMGGALFNQGVLTLDDVTLSGNQATGGTMIYHADPIPDQCGVIDFLGHCGWGWTDQLMYGAGGMGEDGGFFIFVPCHIDDLDCTNPRVQSGGMGGAVPMGQASGVDNDKPVLRSGGGVRSGFGGNVPPPETAEFGGNGGGAGGNIPGTASFDGPGGGGFRGGGNFGAGGITPPARRASVPRYGSGGSVGGGGAGGGFGGGARVLGVGGFGGYNFEHIHSTIFFQAAGGFGGGGIGFNPTSGAKPERIGGGGGGLGGAIFNHFGTVTLRNSTLVGNRAQGGASIRGNGHGFGGAVFNLNGGLTVSFSTVAGNTAEAGGAIYSLGYNAIARTAIPNAGSSSAVLNLNNSILAGSVTDTATATSDLVLALPPQTAGGPNVATVSIYPSGKNLVMQAVNSYDAPALPTFALTTNPLLGALASNSGPTQTLLPGSGSPVIDAADACTGAAGGNNGADQRGVPRPQGARCDLGAVEVVPVPLAQAITGFAATPANPVYATHATFTVSATGGASGNPVTFSIAAGSASGCSISASTVTIITAGVCTVLANQAGSPSVYAAAPQATLAVTIGKAAQTLSFTSSAPASASVGGATYTPTAISNRGLTPVVLSIAASASGVCSLNAGVVSFIGAGSCAINANQAGNTNYNAAAQVQQTFTVAKVNSSTALTASSATPVFGQSVTFTATVAGKSPTGNVSFIADGSTTLCTSALTGTPAVATCATAVLVAGNHAIGAHYGGDASNNSSASAALTVTVARQSQTLSFTSTAPVNATAGGAPYLPIATSSAGLTPVVLGIAASASGVCSLDAGAVSFLGAGSCVINANHAGNSNYSAATQVQQTVTVAQASSGTALASSSASSVFGDSVDFTATVTGANPTGSVSFIADASTTLCTGVLTGTAIATCSTAALEAGDHAIVAHYDGDADNTESESAAVQIGVDKQSQTLSFSSTAPANATAGGATYVPVATSSVGMTPVVLSIATSASDVCSLDAGAVSFIGAGSCVIDANQAGNTNYNAAAQVQQTFKVENPSSSTALASSSASSVFGQSLAFTATVTGTNPTGSVDFIADASTTLCTGVLTGTPAVATCVTAVLEAGTRAIVAHYSGDDSNSGSVSAVLAITVDKQSTTTVLTTACSTSFVENRPFFLDAMVEGGDPTGTITFSNAATSLCVGLPTVSGIATCDVGRLLAAVAGQPTTYGQSATYSGDGNHASSVSPLLAVTVQGAGDEIFRDGWESSPLPCPIE